ncbi:MAG: J domain-containing protein [Terracidiphilus sp.]|nr:J domain-containing protein [Terracidiphilus sp.]
MPCVCTQCLQHARTLGLPGAPPTKDDLQKAYREAAKRWHPDRFESDPAQRPEAEERFKRVQVAYRELAEHHDHPINEPPLTLFAKPADPPPFSFDNAPGCFIAPHFPADVDRLIREHLGPEHTPLAIVDLSRPGSPPGSFSQFLLLTGRAVLLRHPLNIVSLLWYTELGEVTLSDRRSNGNLTRWQQLADRFLGPQPNYTLHIFRRNGALFSALSATPDDSVKRVVYNFLLRKKHEP